MKLTLLLLAAVAVYGVPAKQDEDEQIQVPSDVLRFILGCQRDVFGDPDGPLPVYHTDINTSSGTTSQKVTLLDPAQLRQSLKGSVHSEEVLDLIIGQLSAAVKSAAINNNRLRNDGIHSSSSNSTPDNNHGCTVTNNIEVSVPAQEVDDFNDRVQMLIQQNSFLLLEQINTLFTYKLRSLREDFENMVRERTKKMNRKLDAVLKALDVAAPADTEDKDECSPPVTESSAEVENSTDNPNEVDQQSQEENTTDVTPSEDTSDEAEEEVADKRTESRPVPVPTVINNRRPTPTRYEASRPTSASRPTAGSRPTSVSRPSRYRSGENAARLRQRQLARQSFMRRQRKPTNIESVNEEE